MILRLINNPIEYEEVTLPVNYHVQQRIEDIVYKSTVDNFAVPLAYLDSQDIYADINISLVDRHEFLPENSIRRTFLTNAFEIIQTASYSTQYPDLWLTNKSITDSFGNSIPLFYAHELPNNTTTIKIEHVTNKGSKQLDFGYLIDTNLSKVYFNFTNEFNPLSGGYSLYFITATSSDGTIVKGLINPQSSIREATWEDIDQDTGDLKDDFVYYWREANSTGYTFYFNKNETIYVKPRDTAIIAPLKFPNKLSISGWFPRFSTGEFKHTGPDAVARRYFIPEYEDISFFPSRPYFFDSSADVLAINKKVIFLGRRNLAIDQETKPVDIVISDFSGIPLYAFTTEITREGDKYTDDIDWSIDEIASWDNEAGLIELTIDIKAEWVFHISYYYEVKELLYTYTNLNPLQNSLVYNHYYVYYVKPDAIDRAIHHLVVRNDGIIVDCSDEDFQLLDSDGNYNSSTFVGMTYRTSVVDPYRSNDWIQLYSVEGTNIYQYLILAEYFFVETEHPTFINAIDVSRPGNVLAEDSREAAVYRNPNLYHSEYAATPYGVEYPQNNAYVLRLSYSLLEDYGGIFTQDALTDVLRTYVASGKYLLFEWDETIYDLAIDNETETEITLSWSRVGFGFSYDVYRSTAKNDGFELIDTATSNSLSVTFTDTALTVGQVYYYYIIPTKDDVEYPKSYTIGAQIH